MSFLMTTSSHVLKHLAFPSSWHHLLLFLFHSRFSFLLQYSFIFESIIFLLPSPCHLPRNQLPKKTRSPQQSGKLVSVQTTWRLLGRYDPWSKGSMDASLRGGVEAVDMAVFYKSGILLVDVPIITALFFRDLYWGPRFLETPIYMMILQRA